LRVNAKAILFQNHISATKTKHMKKLIPVLFIFILTACAKKEWSKSYVTEKCLKEMNSDKDVSGTVSKENINKICDFAADKMMAKYQTEGEANGDKDGAEQIGRDCAMEVMMGGNGEIE
jgi:uncharacterized lipoprotein YajG